VNASSEAGEKANDMHEILTFVTECMQTVYGMLFLFALATFVYRIGLLIGMSLLLFGLGGLLYDYWKHRNVRTLP